MEQSVVVVQLGSGDSLEVSKLFRNELLTLGVSYRRSGPWDPGCPSLASCWRQADGCLGVGWTRLKILAADS